MKKQKRWVFDTKSSPKKTKPQLNDNDAKKRLLAELVNGKVIRLSSETPKKVDFLDSSYGFTEMLWGTYEKEITLFSRKFEELGRGALCMHLFVDGKGEADLQFGALLQKSLLEHHGNMLENSLYPSIAFIDELLLEAMSIYSPEKEVFVFVVDRSSSEESMTIYLLFRSLNK